MAECRVDLKWWIQSLRNADGCYNSSFLIFQPFFFIHSQMSILQLQSVLFKTFDGQKNFQILPRIPCLYVKMYADVFSHFLNKDEQVYTF